MAENETPRGGIRISSDPETTRVEQPHRAARKRVELPFRLLYAADLLPQDVAASIRHVDKNTFSKLINELAPQLELDVPNYLSDSPRLLEITLTFSSLEDFVPHRLARQVPALGSLLDVRKLVARVKRKEIDLKTFRSQLEDLGVDSGWAKGLYNTLASTAAAPKPRATKRESNGREAKPADDSLDRLFSMVDDGTGEADSSQSTGEPAGLVDALMGAVTGPHAAGPKAEMAAVDLLLADLDQTLGRQLNAVMGHPRLRELESAWRGLKFLVDRLDFRRNIELDVLPVRKADVDNGLYREVLVPEHEQRESLQLSCIVLGFTFDSAQADASLLEELAATAASLQVPIVASVGPAFFGIERETGLSKLPVLWQHLEGPQYIAWNKLRNTSEARHLALALPAFLLRASYGSEHPAGDFDFSEQGQLWGGAALLVAAAAAESYADTGWPTKLTHYPIGDLSLWRVGSDVVPLAAAFSTEKLSELADAGFVALGCWLGRDEARVVHEPTLGQTPGVLANNRSLSGQLFMAQTAHFLLSLQQSLTDAGTTEDVEAEAKAHLESFLAGEDGAVDVDGIQERDDGSPSVLRIRLRTPTHVLDPPAEITLGLPLTAAKGPDVTLRG